MTDQLDLAADPATLVANLESAAVCHDNAMSEYGSMDGGKASAALDKARSTLLAYIELQRQALSWALKQACIESDFDLDFDLRLSGTEHQHLRAVLQQALGS